MSDNKLGQPPTEDKGRDAVHIAIISIKAGCNLTRGENVIVDENGDAIPANDKKPCGIVDPFGPFAMKEGEWFWLCLYPQSITSLQHVWQHPMFPEIGTQEKKPEGGFFNESITWLQGYVYENCPY